MTTSSLQIKDLPTVFANLTPIPQDDGNVARIDYTDDFVVAYDYLRAVWKADERSERALKLTTLCLELNPANYTVWHFRRVCLEALKLWNEYIPIDMQLAARLGGDNPKNYQIWYHRRALLEKLKQDDETSFKNYCQQELDYIATVLKEDGKNYHAFSHRQWILQTLNDETTWKAEIETIDKLLNNDVRNNSAWNQRWFVSHRAQQQQSLSLEQARVEAEYALEKARLDPYNESPWRFLIAILKEQIHSLQDAHQITSLISEYEEKIWAVQDVLKEAGKDPNACPSLISAVVDILEWQGDQESLEKAHGLVQSLGGTHDPIRRKYWALRAKQIQEKLES